MERAAAFALVAEEYARGRPGYPGTAIRWLLGEEPLDVADLGAGTGKLTAALVAEGHRVIAIEPLPEMRAQLEASVPEAEVRDGRAEQTGLETGSVDAVVVGAAFHWFDHARAFPEIARILRVGGGGILGVLGNGVDTSTAWAARMREITRGSRLSRGGHPVEPEELRARFASVDEGEFAHEEIVDRSRLLDLALSHSSVALLEPDERRRLLAQISALWDEEPELRDRESVPLGYLTRVRRCRGVLR